MKDFILKYKFLFLILLIVFFILIFLFSKKKALYVVNNDSIFSYDKEWSCTTDLSHNDLSNIKVFSGNDYVGKFDLKYNEGWIFDSDIDDVFFGGSDVSMISSEMSYDDGRLDSYISSYLNSRGINDYGSISLKRFFEYDFDGDGTLEMLVEATNYNSLSDVSTLFSFVFMYDDDIYYDISFNMSDDFSNLFICNVKNVFNVLDDEHVEYIVSCGHFSKPESFKDSLYSYTEMLSFCN